MREFGWDCQLYFPEDFDSVSSLGLRPVFSTKQSPRDNDALPDVRAKYLSWYLQGQYRALMEAAQGIEAMAEGDDEEDDEDGDFDDDGIEDSDISDSDDE